VGRDGAFASHASVQGDSERGGGWINKTDIGVSETTTLTSSQRALIELPTSLREELDQVEKNVEVHV